MSIIVLIPAYKPDQRLLETLRGLSETGLSTVVVDDGSPDEFKPIFDEASKMRGVEVIRHLVNLGKGAALRTGFNHAFCRYRHATGVVTADADGQHRAEDIVQVALAQTRSLKKLILGVRSFNGKVPLRSRIGNRLTSILYRGIQGQALRDTQTGLRGVPKTLAAAMLRSPASGYEFEIEMLIVARRMNIEVEQVEIATVYHDNNASSHFNPLFDSVRIYFLLLRFSLASLLTAVCDNAVFSIALSSFGAPLPAQVIARVCAVFVNFTLNRNLVFASKEADGPVLGRYLAVVAASGFISYLSLISLHRILGIPLLTAKVAVECVLFLANFTLLRDFVFVDSKRNDSTDWTEYYGKVPWTARLTRKYTARSILNALRRATIGGSPDIFEFGGGNSCFLDPIVRQFHPASYHVMDTNTRGLELLRKREADHPGLVLHQQNVLELHAKKPADVVFSVGLVEHFDPAGTARCVKAHFDNVRPGGWVLITFPTPTWLYRATRGLLETFALWKFHDERPLTANEVGQTASEFGELVWEKTLWPLFLTQHLMLYKRKLPERSATQVGQEAMAGSAGFERTTKG